MKRSIASALALALGVISLSLVFSDSTARAQQRQRFRADTGVVTLGPNQVLRVTAHAWDLDNDGMIHVGFSRIGYVQTNCNGGVCKHTVSPIYADNGTYPVIVSLMPGEAASMDITPMPNSSGVRGVVASSRRDVRVTAQIINTSTGDITSIWVPQGSPFIDNQ